MPAKKGAAWKQERTTGRKYSGSDSDKEPEPGEREQFWVSGYTPKDSTKVEGYYKKNPAFKGDAPSVAPWHAPCVGKRRQSRHWRAGGKGSTMSGLGDKIKGKAQEAVGKAKEGAGDATDNADMQGSGAADQAKGQGNQAKGEVKEAAADIKDTVTGKRD